MFNRLLIATLTLFCFVQSANSQEWDEPTEENDKLTASDGAEDDWFGFSLYAQDDFLFASAPFDDGDTGAVYVYRHAPRDGKWVEKQKLTASDGEEDDCFGSGIAAFDATVFVSSRYDDDAGDNAGALYVFNYEETKRKWYEIQKLTASDGEEDDQFGGIVHASEDLLAIGVNRENTNGYLAGAAYLFCFDEVEGTWAEEQKLIASDGAVEDRFGGGIARYDVETLLVAAPGYDLFSGAVYVFEYDDTESEWVETNTIARVDGEKGDFFGGVLTTADGRVFVGAPFANNDTGIVYVLSYDDTEDDWIEDQELTASEGSFGDEFGKRLAIYKNTLLIGADRDDDDKNGDWSGSAYLFAFDPDEDEWFEESKVLASDGAQTDFFGISVAMTKSTAFVGCALSEAPENNSGAVYVYNLSPPFRRGDVDSDGEVATLTDALFLLDAVFADGDTPSCLEAADIDDNGRITALVDALYLLFFAFGDGPSPPEPGPIACGRDSRDSLGCDRAADACL